MTLPYDYARCPGSGSELEGWREGCDDCLRRTSPGRPGEWGQSYMGPPFYFMGECVERIGPEDRK